MAEEARRPVPWKPITAALLAVVVVLAAVSVFQFVTRPEEFVPTCPTNFEWDGGTQSCILSDTLAPTGVSSVNRDVAALGEMISFDGGGSSDDVEVTSWTWEFGDGTGATGKTVRKAYYVPGDYIVSLKVQDAAGNTGSNEAQFTRVRVLSHPAPEGNETAPAALLAVDGDVIESGDTVFADGNGSWKWEWSAGVFGHASGSENLDLDYDFGDGSTASGSNVTHTYTSPGNYALRLTAGGGGDPGFFIHTIHVLADPGVYPGEVKNPDTLIFTTIAEGEHLDPARAYDSASGDILRSVYETLVLWDRDSLVDLDPMIASQVPTEANGLIDQAALNYTFPIRQGVKFHNGDTLTCADVEYSLERNLISDYAGGPMWLIMEPLIGYGSFDASTNPDPANITQATFDAWTTENITAIKDSIECVGSSLVLRLDFVFPPFLGMLSGWGVFIMNKDYLINEKDQWPMTYDLATVREYNRDHTTHAMHGDDPGDVVGTGPYVFKAWDPDVQIVLERFDDYWRAPAPTKFVIVKNVPEWGTRKLMFLNGDTDFISVPQVFREQVIGAPGVRLISGLPDLAISYIGLNEQIDTTGGNLLIGSGTFDDNADGTPDGIPANFFEDEYIRRAFSWAFDYDTYITDVVQDLGEQPFGPIPRGLLGYTDQGPKYSFDLAKAEANFKASSMWPTVWDTGFNFIYQYNEGNEIRKISGEMLRDTLVQINPKFIIDVQPVPWGEFLDSLLLGRGTMFAIGWGADYPDPHNFAHPFMRSGDGAFPIWTSYVNATVDGWIDAAARNTDPAQRELIYHDIQEAGFWDPPGVWRVQPLVDHFERDWVIGWYYNAVTEKYYYDYSKG